MCLVFAVLALEGNWLAPQSYMRESIVAVS